MTVKEELAGVGARVEAYLSRCLDGRGIPARLDEAMRYSLMAGGKRLRPALCLTFATVHGLGEEPALPFACAFELIHTYSLIHDDLPAMDDDDLRRGKPSNHKMFGEATAILAGDGLLTEAMSLVFECAAHVPADRVAAAGLLLSQAAGAGGMVGGQQLDMDYTGKAGVTLAELRGMHALKTGALIRAACESGAVLAGADAAAVAAAHEYGAALGAAFQIADDILDVVGDTTTLGKPVGSDEAQGKNTYPSLLGLDESRKLALAEADRAVAALAGLNHPKADFLRRLARYVVDRVQ